MGLRVPESQRAVASPSGALPAPSASTGAALRQVGRQVADISTELLERRYAAQANALALQTRGQLMELTDRINSDPEIDPIDAESTFQTQFDAIIDALGEQRLPSQVVSQVRADAEQFALTQQFKVRAAARKRTIDIGRAATLAGIDVSVQMAARAENPLDLKQALRGMDVTFALASESRYFSEEAIEKMRQASTVDLYEARTSHLIVTGRAAEALTALQQGTMFDIDAGVDPLPPKERHTLMVRAGESFDRQFAVAERALKLKREAAHADFLEQIATSYMNDAPVNVTHDDLLASTLSAAQFKELTKAINAPSAVFGSRDRVTDPRAFDTLWTLASVNKLSISLVLNARADLSAEDYVSLLREARAIQEGGGTAQGEDVRRGLEQINVAYGLIGQTFIAKLRPEELLQMGRDKNTFIKEVQDAFVAGRKVDAFAIADRIASTAMANVRIPALMSRSVRLGNILPDPSKWSVETLDTETRMAIELRFARKEFVRGDYESALSTLSQAIDVQRQLEAIEERTR